MTGQTLSIGKSSKLRAGTTALPRKALLSRNTPRSRGRTHLASSMFIWKYVESLLNLNLFRAFEISPKKAPTPGSIGKLRISSEMRQKLEMVTSNHSMRSTTKPEKPSLLPMKEQKAVKKLEDNRKLLLEQQLGQYLFSIEI